ncbi:MAG: TM1812 family CRISPR-associated protein, partial [Epsilonproteobacteria bacterium]|nr:TM1812 family CRISPR-associated protein [Campylobacterota bacterium]
DKYINMLPLLIHSYSGDYDIIALATKDAKSAQSLVLEHYEAEDMVCFCDISEQKENEYSEYFKMVNTLLEGYEEVVIDLSHGFRHLPLLTLIALIMQNINHQNKIKHILFAQEIQREEEYKIIDLIEYLDLANLSFMLSTFNDNYTVSNNIKFKNELYTKISEELSQFSHHFLSNSLKPLMEGSLIMNIIEQLDKLKQEESISNFGDYIDEIINHLEEIKKLNEKQYEFEKLYELSQIMSKRGYLLNAITLLFEAIGFYCAASLKKISPTLETHIEYFEDNLIDKKAPKIRFSTYALVNQSRNFVKQTVDFAGDYLYNPEIISWANSRIKNASSKPKVKIDAIHREIISHLASIKINDFTKFIREMEVLRNNLAHGNTS